MGTCHSSIYIDCPLMTSFYSPGLIFGRLPALGADPDTITISGLSGGSTGAATISTAYSDTYAGVGLWIGSSFGENTMLDEDEVDPVTSAARNVQLARDMYADGDIDDPSNISGWPVYIFSGTEDETVVPSRQKGQKNFYETLGANVDFHEEPVDHGGFYCDEDEPYCGENLVQRMMTHLLSNLG